MENIENFRQSFKAEDWAKAFCHYYNTKPDFKIDEELMIGWFANALMRGYDEYRWKEEREKQEINICPTLLDDKIEICDVFICEKCFEPVETENTKQSINLKTMSGICSKCNVKKESNKNSNKAYEINDFVVTASQKKFPKCFEI